MKSAELIQRLEALESLAPEAVFVLLWSYFEKNGVGTAEKRIRQTLHPFKLPELLPEGSSLPDRMARALASLKRSKGEEDREVLALRWLKGIDRWLHDRKPKRFHGIELPGFGDRTYRVRRRNDYIPEALEARVVSEQHMSASLAAYARFHKAVPQGRQGDYEIACLDSWGWGDPLLHARLLRERSSLKILIWPFEVEPDYPGLEPLSAKPIPEFVHLDQIRNEAALQDEVRKALLTAREKKVTMLVFPELSIAPATYDLIRRQLAANAAPDDYPILTLFGCTHRRNEADTLDFNEAALLGPGGSEVYRHRKLTVFTGFAGDRVTYFGEQLEQGSQLAVLECAFGNIVPLICLDFIHPVLLAGVVHSCHGNLFVVPSLSAKTGRYETSAELLEAPTSPARSSATTAWRRKRRKVSASTRCHEPASKSSQAGPTSNSHCRRVRRDWTRQAKSR